MYHNFPHLFIVWYLQLEAMEKGNGDPFISMGLVDPYDLFLSEWFASIIGPPNVRQW